MTSSRPFKGTGSFRLVCEGLGLTAFRAQGLGRERFSRNGGQAREIRSFPFGAQRNRLVDRLLWEVAHDERCVRATTRAGGQVDRQPAGELVAYIPPHIEGFDTQRWHRQPSKASTRGAARLACCLSCWSKTSRVIWQASRIRGSANE